MQFTAPRFMVPLAVLLYLSVTAYADEAPTSRALVIGIDGLRPDAIASAKTPHLDRLIRDGAYSDSTQILGSRYIKNDTISGPGWSSFLTGVWADKHGVHDNSFKGKNYGQYPHFFTLLKRQFPAARTGSFVDWEPIDKHIVSAADVRKVYPAEGAEGYSAQDSVISHDASEFLLMGDPHVAMVYFGAVDETGHRHGFHPTVPQYIEALEKVDGHIGELLESVDARPNHEREDWLIIVSTDHGGKGTGHGNGHEVPEIRTTFLIVSGPSARQEKLDSPTYVVDVAPTALVHLGVALDPKWKLDGTPVDLRPSSQRINFGGVSPRVIIQPEEEVTRSRFLVQPL